MQESLNEVDRQLLEELREPAATMLDEHLNRAKVWYPYEEIPWGLAEDFKRGESWDPAQYPLPDGVRSAIYVNLLTEDNLPYYTHTILSFSDRDHPLSEWTRRWTAEERRHSDVIRDWAIATRAIDPKLLEDGRMVQMSGGKVPQPTSVADMLAYTSLQELATNIAHRNTGAQLDKERKGSMVMARVAGDEMLHHRFYKGLAGAAIEVNPSEMVVAISQQIRSFKMPGTGIPDFKTHEKAIAEAGIYDLSTFLFRVVEPTLEAFEFDEIRDISAEAEKERERTHKFLGRLSRLATK